MLHTLLLRKMEVLKIMDLMPCVHIWDVSFHGLLPKTSLCVHVMDLNTPPMDMLYVDPPHFHWPLPTVNPMRRVALFSALGQRLISELRESLGGSKHVSF